MIDIGENIREIRKLKGMTQKELGNKLGISQSAINQFENNKTDPKLQTIEKLAIALEISMYDILKIGAEYYQPTGVNLDINIIKNALHSHEAFAETPLDKVTVTALKELLEYKETGLTPQQLNNKFNNKKVSLSDLKDFLGIMGYDYEIIIKKRSGSF